MIGDRPAWARDAVFYQVFPDRFAASPRVPKPGTMEAWSSPPTAHGYKGGDLLGLAERIPELVDLGVSALSLNPIFSAASNHRYNAYDFLAVDPLLGGEAAFRELLDVAHANGIRVILDGVFNHVGRGFWPFYHIIESGGASPYRDWFYLDEDVLNLQRGVSAFQDSLCPEQGPRGYRSWWDVPSLPKLRIEHPPVREYLMGVTEHWTRFGIDGWRLDVPEDIDDPTFWPEFRRRVRAVNPEAYIVGEIWHEAPEWLAGDRFDALMNYPLGLAILGFVGGPAIDGAVIQGQANYRDALVALDAEAFAGRLVHNLSVNSPEATAVQFNLIGSHDSPRARSVMGGDPLRLRLAALLQLTLPGTPCIYYGDEIAMTGGPDPECRGAFPARLTDVDPDGLRQRSFVKAAIRARRDHVALRRGEVRPLATEGRAVVLERTAEGHRAAVALNAGESATRLVVPAGALAGLRRVEDLTTGRASVAIDGGSIELGAHSAAVFTDA